MQINCNSSEPVLSIVLEAQGITFMQLPSLTSILSSSIVKIPFPFKIIYISSFCLCLWLNGSLKSFGTQFNDISQDVKSRASCKNTLPFSLLIISEIFPFSKVF